MNIRSDAPHDQKPLILRVSSLPTANKPGMGLAAAKLMGLNGFDTHVISYKVPNDHYEDDQAVGNITFFDFPNPTMPKVRLGWEFYFLQIRRAWAIISFFLNFMKGTLVRKPKILHVHSPLHFLFIQWARIRGVKTFLTFHGTDFLRVKESYIYRFLLTGIDNICCVSELHMDDLQAIFPKAAIHLVSNGVDVEQFSPILPVYSCENTIVAVGTLRWHKGFDNLIRMFSRIALTYPQWKLKIIGDGPDKELLESIVSSHELQNKVFLCGAMGREELANELVNAKIFALSSVTEGLPKVLLEAMSANCACVAFNVGDCERVLGDAGISIKENDESAFINGMVLLMESSTLCSEFGYKANARAAQFSWEAYASVHVMLYKQALLKISSSNQREGV